MIYRNSGLPSGGFKGPVGEPSTDVNGRYVFQTGNAYATYSNDNGSTWTFLDPFTLFGSGFCCDQVTVYDQSHDRQFWLLQYFPLTTGASNRLVLASSDGQDRVNWCYYTLSPQYFGFANGVEFDYNHMAVSTSYVYVTTNVAGASGGSLVFRMPIDGVSACGGVGIDYAYRTTESSNAFVQNAADTMYWGTDATEMTLGSTFRVLRWPDSGGSISVYSRSITPFSWEYGNTGYCGGGGILNWCQRTDSRMTGGGYLATPSIGSGGGEGQAVLGFAFNARQDGNHPYPYVRRIYFRAEDVAYLGASEIWATWTAYQYPDMAPDQRGHVGIVAAWGGGGYYPGAAVLIDDDFTPTQPWSRNDVLVGAGQPCLNVEPNGDTDRRWGDYLTVRPLTPARYGWVASVFALNSNAGYCNQPAAVNARNVAFGRSRDSGAYARWKGK